MSSTMRTRIWSAIWVSFFYLAILECLASPGEFGRARDLVVRHARHAARCHGRGCCPLLFVLLGRKDRLDELRTDHTVAVNERLEDHAGRPRWDSHDRLPVLVDEILRRSQRERDGT